MPGAGVTVVGLDSLIKDLRAANRALPRVVSKSLRDTSKRIAEPAVKSNAATAPRTPSEAPSAFRAFATQKAAGIRIDYAKYPWAAGAEFGSLQYRQFRPWVGNQYTAGNYPGYIVGKAIRDKLPELEKAWLDDVVKALSEVGGLSNVR